jgi:predicted dipeptidase
MHGVSMKILTICLIFISLSLNCQPQNKRTLYRNLASTHEELLVNAFLKKINSHENLSLRERAAALGAFVRTRKKEVAIELLGKLVATQTYFNPDIEPADNPEFAKASRIIESFCKENNLVFNNHYGKIYEVKLDGSFGNPLAIYTHLDTVAAIVDNWILPNGKTLNPFKLNRIGGKLYGRGAEDDKGSIASALTAMATLATLPRDQRPVIRLFIETTEETGGGGFKYYMERNEIPSRNIVLDSRYPVVVAEKGYGTLSIYFPAEKPNQKALPQVVFFRGGMARNQIPETAAMKLSGSGLEIVEKYIQENAMRWEKEFGENFSVFSEQKGKHLWLTCKGISTHASAPQDGLNPVSRCLHIIDNLYRERIIANNAYAQASKIAVALFGLNETGRKMKIDYEDFFMGPLTAAVTFLQLKDNKLELAINLRAPKGRSVIKTKQKIDQALEKYKSTQETTLQWKIALEHPMTRNPNQPWITELLTIFEEVTGKPGNPRAESGATTARQIPNAVNFGPAMPGEKYRGHTALEYKTEQNLEYDLQMFTEMMIRIPGLQETR